MKKLQTGLFFSLLLILIMGCQSQALLTVAPTDSAANLTNPTSTSQPTATVEPTPASSPTPNPTTPPTATASEPEPNPTATTAELEPTPTEMASADAPPPTLFEIPWDDRTVFQAGLIEKEQAILDELPGASVYHIDMAIDEDMRRISGTEEVLYTNQEDEPLNEVYFRLFPNLASGATSITGLTVNEQAVDPTYESGDSALRVPLTPALQSGERIVIRMNFEVEVPAGEGGNYGTFAFLNEVLALAHFYPMIAVYDHQGWNIEVAPPIGDVVYADASFYIVRVTAPAEQVVVASGIELERAQTDDRQTLTLAAGPMRDFYLAASHTYELISATIGEITVNSYAPADLAEGSEVALQQAVDALKSFNERFGPYPYTEFDMVSTTTFALGIEYPGIVAILVDLYAPDGRVAGTSTSILLEAVVAHEVAHQWFYGLVGNDQIDEPWLDEAMAQFATLLYYSDVYGPDGSTGFRRSLEGRWQRVDRADIPIGLPVGDYSSQEYGAIVYGRGPLFIEALSEVMGPADFAAFVKIYYQTFRWQIATAEDFQGLAEQQCDCDLTALFEEWVYQKDE